MGKAFIHIRKRVLPGGDRRPQIMVADEVFAVGENDGASMGVTIDLSGSVRSWTEVNEAGQPRILRLELYRYNVEIVEDEAAREV